MFLFLVTVHTFYIVQKPQSQSSIPLWPSEEYQHENVSEELLSYPLWTLYVNCCACNKIWLLLSQRRELPHRLCILISYIISILTIFRSHSLRGLLNFKRFLACFCSKRQGSTYSITVRTSLFPLDSHLWRF